MFGEQIKKLREDKNLLQREVAALLEVDTAYISKIERNEKTVSRNHLPKLASLFKMDEEQLLTIWLADKVYQVISEENNPHEILKVAEENITYNKKN
jgi:transcriptional regulator with XRE-family HTH domain